MTAPDALAAVVASPERPAKVMVSGGIGTGKTTALAGVREALRSAGVAVLSRVPRAGDPADAAVVIDDAHLLPAADLESLAELVTDPARTVVIAAEPLAHHRELVALRTAMEREAPVVALTALGAAEIARVATESLGAPPAAAQVRAVLAATSGVPFLVRAAVGALAGVEHDSTQTVVDTATRVSLIERLRRVDEPVLDTLLISSLGHDLGPDDVSAALGADGRTAHLLVDQARATGLIAPSQTAGFTRALHHCVAEILGATRHHDLESRLLRAQTEASTLSLDLALSLADHGLNDPRLADALVGLAAEVRGRPQLAARLYRAAGRLGSRGMDVELADALALTGDCAAAGELADTLLTTGSPAERAAAVRIAASVATHDGQGAQAAELFNWLGPYPDAVVGAAGAVVALGAGDAATARAVGQVQTDGPPTSAARAARRLADGLLLTVGAPYPAVMAQLAQALTDQSPQTATPDSTAALVTLVALHGGDAVRSRSVISRAVRTAGAGGPGVPDAGRNQHRHRLLLAWAQMQDGQLAAAQAAPAPADTPGLHRRDALWAAALHTAIARRAGDTGTMQKHWYSAMEVLTEYSMDLYSLLPLGELWVAAAYLRRVDALRHTLDEAFGLLGGLGDPVLWSVPLHWAGVHAGILANSPEAVAPHGQALTAAAATSPFAKALATAGRGWLRVLANKVDIDDVTAAARSLTQFGLTWDATRLASQAALHAEDPRVSGAMLQLARDLKLTSSDADDTADAVDPGAAAAQLPAPAEARAQSRLSDREREVAELLLQGMPYRDIGSQLFISAKTVEHHVARIRRRLGAESRSELLSMLRALLGSPD